MFLIVRFCQTKGGSAKPNRLLRVVPTDDRSWRSSRDRHRGSQLESRALEGVRVHVQAGERQRRAKILSASPAKVTIADD